MKINMIKIIKRYLLFLIVFLGDPTYLYSMEQSSSIIPILSLAEGSLKNFGESNEKDKEEVMLENDDNSKSILSNIDLKEVFNLNDTAIQSIKENLEKLNLLANVLVFQEWLIDKVKKVFPIALLLLNSCLKLHPKYALSSDSGNFIGSKYSRGSHVITSVKANNLINKVSLYLLYTPIYDSDKISEYYKYCSKLINDCSAFDGYEDTIMVAHYNKYYLENRAVVDFLHGLFDKTKKILLKTGLNLNYDLKGDTSFNALINLLKEKLPEITTSASNNNLLVNFLSLGATLNNLQNKIKLDQWPFELELISDIVAELESTVKNFDSDKAHLGVLYTKILTEQNEIIKNITNVSLKNELFRSSKKLFLHPQLSGTNLPKYINQDSKISASMAQSIDKKETIGAIKIALADDQADFIDQEILTHNAPQSQPSKKAKNKPKRKARHRSHRKTETTDRETSNNEHQKVPNKPTIIKFPCYADRIIKRFNKIPNIDDLYHTFSPLADAFIIKYGDEEQRRNKTFVNGTDIKYSILGQIKFRDGNTELGKFGVTLGCTDNICYHREFISSVSIQEKNGGDDTKHGSDPIALVSEEDSYISARLLFNAANDEIYGEKRFHENSKSIVIEDTRNEVVITLFKTSSPTAH